MPRKKPNKQKQQPREEQPRTSESSQKKKVPSNPRLYIPFLKNVITFFVVFFIGFYLVQNIAGYVWLKDKFIVSNLKKMEQFKEADIHTKYEAYFGFNYRFLTYINENTYDSAIILMPPDSVIFPAKGKSDFETRKRGQSIKSKVWSMYFVYPKHLIYPDELEDGLDYTHVACVNGWGYQYLDFPLAPQQRTKYQVLPRKVEDLNNSKPKEN